MYLYFSFIVYTTLRNEGETKIKVLINLQSDFKYNLIVILCVRIIKFIQLGVLLFINNGRGGNEFVYTIHQKDITELLPFFLSSSSSSIMAAIMVQDGRRIRLSPAPSLFSSFGRSSFLLLLPCTFFLV